MMSSGSRKRPALLPEDEERIKGADRPVDKRAYVVYDHEEPSGRGAAPRCAFGDRLSERAAFPIYCRGSGCSPLQKQRRV